MVKGKVDKNDRMGKLKESKNQISTMKVIESKNEKGIVKEKESENEIRKAAMERKNKMAMLKPVFRIVRSGRASTPSGRDFGSLVRAPDGLY